MKVQELRVGNWVEYAHDSDECTTIQPSSMEHTNEFKPIPITKEWLVKFGFISDGIKHLTHSIHKLTVDVRLILMYQIVYEQPEISTLYIKGIQLISTITYVHQLQNLYYALTGKELTI